MTCSYRDTPIRLQRTSGRSPKPLFQQFALTIAVQTVIIEFGLKSGRYGCEAISHTGC